MYGNTQTKIVMQSLTNNNFGQLIEEDRWSYWLGLFNILMF